MLPGGIIGVDLFFVLSGFLITSLLLERRATGDTSVARFYRRRALRLIPPLVLMLLATDMAAELTNPGHWHLVAVSTLSTLLYGANWAQVHGKFEIEYLHVWSLAIEEQFYIVWAPLVLWLLAKQVRERVIMEVSALAALTVAMWRLHLIRVAPFAMVYPRTDARADALLIGAVLALSRPLDWMPAVPTRVVRVAGLCAFSAFLASTFTLHQRLLFDGGFTAVAAISAVMIAAALDNRWRMGALLSSSPLVAIGRVSYGIYLFHFPIFVLVGRLGPRSAIARLVMALLLTAMATVGSWQLVEKPALRLKSRIDSDKKELIH